MVGDKQRKQLNNTEMVPGRGGASETSLIETRMMTNSPNLMDNASSSKSIPNDLGVVSPALPAKEHVAAANSPSETPGEGQPSGTTDSREP